MPVTLQDIHDVFELRLMLEPTAARMAAGKVNTQRLNMYDEVCREGYERGNAKSTGRFLEANKAFHVTIAQATGNARLAGAIEHLLDEMTRLLHLGLGLHKGSQDMLHEHRTLVKALARGDGETAERICRDQIETARATVLAAILTSRSVLNLAITSDA
jgi:DNA-binding GntR family transcriptional regulator